MIEKKVLTIYIAIVLAWISIWAMIAVAHRDNLFDVLMVALLVFSNLLVAVNLLYTMITKGVTARGGLAPMGIALFMAAIAFMFWLFMPNNLKTSFPFQFIPWIAFGLLLISLATLSIVVILRIRANRNSGD